MAVPYTFGTATAAIPLSQLDSNFATAITLGNTAVYLGNTTTSIGNLTLTNVTISSGNVTLTNVSVTTANVSGTANITTLVATNDATISGLTVGKGAGAVSTNTALGASALATNTSGANNTFLGWSSGYYNTTGSSNTAVGSQAYAQGGSSATGSFNVAIGQLALQATTTASNNTAVGYQAGYTNSTGGDGTYIGRRAGYVVTGGANTFVGESAGVAATTGIQQTFIGQGAGSAITTGSKNTILGAYSGNQGGLDIRTASNFIVLSDGDGNPNGYCDNIARWWFGKGGSSNTYDGNVILSGSSASGYGPKIVGSANGSAAWNIGSYSSIFSGVNQYFSCVNTSGGVYLNGASATSWTAVSDETRKVIIEDITDATNKVSTLRTVIGRLKTDDETVRRPYLIAQDVQKVLPEAVSESEDKEGPVLGLSYTEVIPLLVASIKELKAEVDSLKAQINGASA